MCSIRSLALAPLLAASAACAVSAPAAPNPPAPAAAREFAGLEYVPADTPYALAALAAFPWDVVEQWMPAEWSSAAGPDGDGRPTAEALAWADPAERLWWAYVDEAARFPDGAGPFRDLRMVVYGLSVYPAVRAEVADAAAVRALLDRVAEVAGVASDRHTIGGEAVVELELDDALTLVLAFPSDREVAAGVFPSDLVEPLTRVLLGVDRPDRTLADTGRLAALRRDHALPGYLVGFVDTGRLLDQLTGRASGVAAFAQPARDPEVRVTAACAPDLYRLAAAFPEIVYGYERFDAGGLDVIVRLVTHPRVGARLAGLAESVPGLTAEPPADGLFVAGLGLDLRAAGALVDALGDELQADPLRCPALAGVAPAVARLGGWLDQVPAELAAIRGAHLVVDEIAPARGPAAVHVRARLAIAAAAPELLLQRASAGLTGGLAILGATAAEPAELSLAGLRIPGVDTVHVATDERAIAVVVAPDDATARADLARTLDGARPAEPPLAVIGFHVGRMMALVQPEGGDPSVTPAMRAVLARWGFMTAALHASARAVTWRWSMRFDR